MNLNLFEAEPPAPPAAIGSQAWLLPGFALPYVAALLPEIEHIATAAPWRHMITPGGLRMSAALSSCGRLGWSSDRHGYRYTLQDPDTHQPWPTMPTVFMELAQAAAGMAGFTPFEPDSCLLNRYLPGSKMSLHQDKNERCFDAPIVSVSLGIAAIFLFGGWQRRDPAQRILLSHGDVVVWGGADRLRYHGILPLKPACHPLLGAQRLNLTFRQAG